MVDDLNHAITIAIGAHAGQIDKGGEPYILHPLRVMLAMTTEEERIAAVLHDVVEDCPEWTIERLAKEGFRRHVDTLDYLTRREHETYADFIDRVDQHPIARLVKIADLRDNLNPKRATKCPPILADRYQKALAKLEQSP